MNELQKFCVFLSQFDLTETKCRQIIDSLDDVSVSSFCSHKFDKSVLSEEMKDKMMMKADEILIKNYVYNLENQEIKLITKYDDEYPEKLKGYSDSPFFLFCKGDLTLLNQKSLAVVGTRKPTSYGKMVTGKLVSDVASKGIVIVSGLAYGVDSIAHRKCLEVGGKTIAVLGSGLNEIYPSEHKSLADEIARKGLLISEYQPNKTATKYTFPQRNRIIAGLGDGVLITEANFKSGTIHTKDYALEYGKNMYAVPGNIDSDQSHLTNDIIKTGQASLVTDANDILKDYNLEKESQQSSMFQLSIDEQKIVSLLEDGMKDIDYLIKNSNLPINNFNSCLTMLEIRGIIERISGGFISLT